MEMLTSLGESDLGGVDREGGVLGRDQERGERGDDDDTTHLGAVVGIGDCRAGDRGRTGGWVGKCTE